MKIHGRHLQTHLFILFVLIPPVLGCIPRIENPEQLATAMIPSATLSVIQDTPTPLEPVAPILTPTTQQTVELSLEQDCIPIEEKISDGLILSGVWVQNQRKPYLENLDEHTKYEVPLKGGSILDTYSTNFSISPDGKQLAYIDSFLNSTFRTEKRILRIINSSGHSLPMDFWTVNWQWIIGWIDNQNLALSVSNSISNNDVIILNPFTGSWKKFEPPQWLKFDDSNFWSLPYSPTLERFWDSDHQHLVLKDIKTGNTVWESDDGGGIPSWSRDGSTLAVVSASSIDIVSKTKQTVKFDIRKLGLDPSWNVALSPDTQKLFFTLDSPEKFVFLDMKKSKIHKLCTNEYELTYASRPFWSPDSRFIVLGVYDSEAYPTYDDFDILIDTEQMRAYKLTTKQYQGRLAWLVEP